MEHRKSPDSSQDSPAVAAAPAAAPAAEQKGTRRYLDMARRALLEERERVEIDAHGFRVMSGGERFPENEVGSDEFVEATNPGLYVHAPATVAGQPAGKRWLFLGGVGDLDSLLELYLTEKTQEELQAMALRLAARHARALQSGAGNPLSASIVGISSPRQRRITFGEQAPSRAERLRG